jgi:TonB-dependent receptor
MRLKLALLIAFIFWCFCLQAQTPKGAIVGSVADSKGSLPSATLRLLNTSFATVTDINGNFKIFNIPAGNYKMVVNYIGYQPDTISFELSEGEKKAIAQIVLKEAGFSTKTVQVKGYLKSSETRAVNMMKNATNVATIIAAEGIGKLPDRNAAEALQRAPAVAMEKNHGEGRYVSLRGTPTEWSSALLNGDRLPVTDEEGKTRALPFDILPSDIIEYIYINKSLNPDIEGDAIGGSINFITRTAPQNQTLNIATGAGYNAMAQKPIYSGNFLYGDRILGGKLGYSLLGSYWQRAYGTDNYQVAYASNYDQSLARLELRDYQGTRTTFGFNAAFDYKFSDKVKWYGKGLYSSFSDDKWLRKTMYIWATGAGAVIRQQTIHALMENKLWGGETGLQFDFTAKSKLNIRVASYENTFEYGSYPFGKDDPRNGYHVNQFIKPNVQFTDWTYLDTAGNVLDIKDETDPRIFQRQRFIKDSEKGGNIQPRFEGQDSISNKDFEFETAYSEINRSRETDPIVVQLDYQQIVSNRLTLKFGAKFREKEGYKFLSLYEWTRNGQVVQGNSLNLGKYGNEPLDEGFGFLYQEGEPYKGRFFNFLTKQQHQNLVNQLGDSIKGLPMNPENSRYPEWVGSQYTYQEFVQSAYAMADYKFNEKLSIVGGLRVENTILRMQADTLDFQKIFFDDLGNPTYPVERRNSNFNYLAVLPMANIRYELRPSTIFRLAATRTFRRPNFNESTPGAALVRFTDLIYDEGNPNLKPSYSNNLDATIELYPSLGSVISIGGFYKYITDHIFATVKQTELRALNQSSQLAIPGIAAKRYENADPSFVLGAEINLIKKFDKLPGFLKNFGVNANLTTVRSRMQVPGRTFTQTLPRQANLLYNVALFYESNRVTTRIALNYRGKYLYELNLASQVIDGKTSLVHQNTEYDWFLNETYSLDYSLSIKVTKRLSCFLELNNLIDYPLIIYRGNEDRPVKVEYFGPKGQAGLKFTL